MSSPRTPSKRRLSRGPSMGSSSFASCFGASTPISPRRTGGYGLLGGQACVSYKRLGFEEDEDEDEHTHIYEATAQETEQEVDERYAHAACRREGHFLQSYGKHFPVRQNGVHYTSEGEEIHGRGRKTGVKLGKQWSKREKAEMQGCHASKMEEEPYASEQEGDEQASRERISIKNLAKLWSMREKNTIYAVQTPRNQEHCHAIGEEEGPGAGMVRERKGVMKLVKLWSMREKARREQSNAEEEPDECGRERLNGGQLHLRMREKEGMCAGVSPRRESLSRKVREACVQVLESARRSSPHLSELFVGNQLLMQVTSSPSNLTARRARNVAPSLSGFLVARDLPLSNNDAVVSPSRASSPSAT